MKGIGVDEGEGENAPRANAMNMRTRSRRASWGIPSRFSRMT
jgi:hypothetical protein